MPNSQTYMSNSPVVTMSKYDILTTGAIIIPSGEYAQFSFDNLNFRFKASIIEKKDPTVDIKIQKEGEFEYVLFDFINQSIGSSGGFYDPFPIASLNGRELSIIFKNEMLNAESGVNILLHYTWLLKK